MAYELAMAARDAGNRSMREGGRSKWSRKDYNAAVDQATELALAGLEPYQVDMVRVYIVAAASVYIDADKWVEICARARAWAMPEGE